MPEIEEETPISNLSNASAVEMQPLSIESLTSTMSRRRPRRNLIGGIAMIGGLMLVLFSMTLMKHRTFDDTGAEGINHIHGDTFPLLPKPLIPKEPLFDDVMPASFKQSPTSTPTKPHQVVTKEEGVMYTIHGDQMYHDKDHFTQGLTYSKSSDILFESNGLYHKSNICRLDPYTGESLLCKDIESHLFAEGMQVYGHGYDEKLIQITWKSQNGFIYNATTLDRLDEFHFETTKNEGWGICLDEINSEFIVSDGSNVLHFWDVESLNQTRTVQVRRKDDTPAKNLNELEFYKGKVLANVWYEDVLLIIDPISGECESEYDFSALWPSADRRKNRAGVFNGISISKESDVIYVTGKKWDRMFKIKLIGF